MNFSEGMKNENNDNEKCMVDEQGKLIETQSNSFCDF